ncbi:MAG: site-specific integrase, partial [Desulfotomaculaceae bacterium]
MPKAKKRSVGKKEKGSWEDSLKDFLFWKKAQGLADSTLSEYNRHVRHFFKLHPDAFSPDKLKSAVLQHLGQDGIKPATYNLRLTYLRHFFSWCITENLLPGNPLQG